MAKAKFYTVWVGRQPGVYETWEDCEEQISGFSGAKYKSFPTMQAAVEAFRAAEDEATETLLTRIDVHNAENIACASSDSYGANIAGSTAAPQSGAAGGQLGGPTPALSNPSGVPFKPAVDYSQIPEINLSAIAVDGACSGNSGAMEYRGVRVADGVELFHVGPLAGGTNNVAEYLALIHGLAMLDKQGDSTTPIYTDSANAVAWVRNRGCRTKLQPTSENKKIFELIARANVWICSHNPRNPILRWATDIWGDIPADFHRK